MQTKTSVLSGAELFTKRMVFGATRAARVFASQDAWRRHPLITEGYKAACPGLRIGAGLFAAYLVLDTVGGLVFGGDDHTHAPRLHYEKAGVGMGITVAEADDDHH